jgi:hypothetical protein
LNVLEQGTGQVGAPFRGEGVDFFVMKVDHSLGARRASHYHHLSHAL